MTYHVQGSIEGVAPILFNRPYTEPSRTQTEEERMATAARERVYKGKAGLYIPAWTFKKMLCVDGATRAGLKVKRTGLTRFLLPSLFLDADPLFGVAEASPELHVVWGKVPPRTGGMVPIYRPMLDTGWHLAFGFVMLDELVAESQIKAALETAGLKIGLGGWRPEYGRFVVRDWKVTKA